MTTAGESPQDISRFDQERKALRAEQAKTGNRPAPGALNRAEKPAAPSPPPSPAPVQKSLSVGMPAIEGFWPVLVIAIVIGAISVLTGHWNAGVLFALLFLVLVGALFPPLAILSGGVVIIYLVFRHAPELFGKANSLTSGQTGAFTGISSGQPGAGADPGLAAFSAGERSLLGAPALSVVAASGGRVPIPGRTGPQA